MVILKIIFCTNRWVSFKYIIHEKHPVMMNVKVSCIMIMPNHTQCSKAVKNFCIKFVMLLPHPPYSPDVAPYDSPVSVFAKFSEWTAFDNEEHIKRYLELYSIHKVQRNFYETVIVKLRERWQTKDERAIWPTQWKWTLNTKRHRR